MSEETYTDSIGWLYKSDIPEGDARKLVSLRLDGMEWVGIRIWIASEKHWYNGNEREQAEILAWMDLPTTVRRHWSRGILSPEFPESKYKDLDFTNIKPYKAR